MTINNLYNYAHHFSASHIALLQIGAIISQPKNKTVWINEL